LDRIEKKADKGKDSSNSKSHKYHDKRRESIIFDRNNHHSQRQLSEKQESIPVLFFLRRNERRYGVDELQG
jgi:hypothetical protein